ncbi:hypothetical protein VB715_18590 [Crocosphaera sp. UHCC 0190]|uniref:hypothetical protein n=1 Tax=Crocosphaera sp. UHCC 0190 TaxID=3110246 RepID=UPI002B20C5AA|nr:hypothetical protein [Crocosphaera sp. UHCC 0190]MEA5511784.1 hypothetical protein [Crocosphaera sp. UHCC 0190]
MPSGRPGGNPDLEKYQFEKKHDWDEPCSDRIQLRLPPRMKLAIKEGKIKDWQEICRKAIAAELEKNPPESGDNQS